MIMLVQDCIVVVEDLYGLLQLYARGRYRRREDLLLPRRPQPRPAEHGTDQVRIMLS